MLSTPSHTAPLMRCVCCAMMTSWTLCATCCAGQACHRPRSPDSLCSTSKAPRVLDHQRESRGDLLFSLEGEQWVGDVSIIQPGAATHRAAAAQTDGSAAARRDLEKTSQYRRYGPGCYHFVPRRAHLPAPASAEP
jgi:hypothetical protein